MAQRTIHYLIGEQLLDGSIENANRFRLGNLLPDAYCEDGVRRITHFTRILEDGTRYSDFEAFRRMFPGKTETDELYLGYYLHLIEDACFRVFVARRRLYGTLPSSWDISFLHQDYHLLNRYLSERYGLTMQVKAEEELESEPICCIYPFRQQELLEALGQDLEERTLGQTRYLTEALLEEFLKEAVPVCRNALQRIRQGSEPLDPMTLTW